MMEDNKNKTKETSTMEIDPFKRRDSIPRSPPFMRERAQSISEISEDRTDAQELSIKRKRQNQSPGSQLPSNSDEVDNMISGLLARARELESWLKSSPNTKMEIKKAGLDILQTAVKLRRERDREREELRPQKLAPVTENGCQTEIMTTQTKKMTADSGIQVDITDIVMENVASELKECSAIKETIKEGHTFAQYAPLLDRKWPERAFELTKMETCRNAKIDDGDVAVFVDPKDLEEVTFKEVLRTHPEVGQLIEEGIVEGQMEFLIKCVKTKSRKQKEDLREQHIFVLPLSIDPKGVNDMETVYQLLMDLKANLVTEKRSHVSVLVHSNMNVLYVRKLLECTFYGQGISIRVVTIDKRPPKQMPTTTESKGATSNKKTPSNDAVIVRADGKCYADLLKRLKSQVKLDDKDLEISKMRKTNQGDLLLELKKGKADELQAIIESSLGFKTTKRVNESVVHIRGLDGVTTAEEVLNAVRDAVGTDTLKSCRVSSLRPAYGENQNATVILDTASANKLESRKTLRIGLVHCQVKKREQDTRCNNCWEVGHETAACKGPNRTSLCKNCGKPGHRQAECTADSFCPLCDQSGHRAWSFNCQRRQRPRRN
nr:unnamed protein product [Callosobruchus analis]